MGQKAFDRKFGGDLLRDLPATPAVYLFKAADGSVLYVGKAKNIRRRLQSYRNASRRKVHRKMRMLVREAASLELRPQASERDALLLENELIRRLEPVHNVDGAYAFLYPAIGVGVRRHQLVVCFTTRCDAFAALDLRWYGVFRSRLRARAAFDALVALLGRAGHREPRSRLGSVPRIRGSQVAAFRRAEALAPGVEQLLAGVSPEVLSELAALLLERPDARKDAASVGEELRTLDDFFRSDAKPLCDLLRRAGRPVDFVRQDERDLLFIADRQGVDG